MNNIIKLAFIVTLALSAIACDKSANDPNKTTNSSTQPAAVQPQTSNPIAQPALDATDKAKQVEGIMKKEEATQKQAIDAK